MRKGDHVWQAEAQNNIRGHFSLSSVTKFHSSLYFLEDGMINFLFISSNHCYFCVSHMAVVFKEKDVLQILVLS